MKADGQLDLIFDTVLAVDLPPQKPQLVFFPMATSTNALWRLTKGGNRVPTEAYIEWISYARWVIHAQRDLWTQIEGPVLLQMLFERRSILSDVDNRLKAAIDVLVKTKVMGDDRQVISLCVSWCPIGVVVDWAERFDLPQSALEGLRASEDGAAVVRLWPMLPDTVNKFRFAVSPDAKGGAWTSQEEPIDGIDTR